MEREEIIKKLESIFEEVLDIQNLVLKDETCADDIEEWDSLNHIQLIMAIEKEFKVKFSASEMLSWANVGNMVDCIINK